MTKSSDFLGFDFFNRLAAEVARDLLGRDVVRIFPDGGVMVARIVEAEAYLAAGDEAAHAARGRRDALAALEAGPGTIYIHPMRQYVGMDLVAVGGSVLLRAAEPVAGIEGDARVMSGPGKFCRVMGITRAMQGKNVLDTLCALRIGGGTPVADERVVVGARVGINRAVALPLRFRVRRGVRWFPAEA